MAATTARIGAAPAVDALFGGPEPRPVLGQRGRRGQQLRRHAGRMGRPVAEPGGDAVAAAVKRETSAEAIDLADLGRRLRVREDGRPAGPDTGPY